MQRRHAQIQIHRGMRRGSEGKHMLTHHPRYLETHTLLKSLIAPLLSTVKLITAAGQSGTRLQQHGKDPLSPSPSIPHSLHQHLVDICAVPAPPPYATAVRRQTTVSVQWHACSSDATQGRREGVVRDWDRKKAKAGQKWAGCAKLPAHIEIGNKLSQVWTREIPRRSKDLVVKKKACVGNKGKHFTDLRALISLVKVH